MLPIFPYGQGNVCLFVVSWNTRLTKRATIMFASKGYAKSEIQLYSSMRSDDTVHSFHKKKTAGISD